MMQSEVTIRYGISRQRETVAWLVPGASPEQWLAEIARWSVTLCHLSLRPLPAGRRGEGLAGALVTTAGNVHPTASHHCQEYGVIGQRFFLPVEAMLGPRILDSEIAELMAEGEDDYVYHPSIGLIRIESEQRLCVSDLLRPPSFTETDWGCAQAVPAPLRPLVSVEPETPPSADAILSDARDDIASEDPKKAPRRSSSARRDSDAGGAATGGLGNAMRRWFDSLRTRFSEWGSRASRGANSAVRNKQVDRLLQLLKENPDEGLRYALPLEGTSHRGTAPPGEDLTRNPVDFNMNRLGGSGPAGVWEVTQQRFESLRRSYRELANRELSLGRHRRAAYIFAHLLGDINAAAAALTDGHHWREAAVLYRDRLSRPKVAAECLEKGQLWSEAIKAYTQLETFEKVGDLYRRIGQEDEARIAYQRAVEQCLGECDYLEAARLADQKMNASQDALRHLAAGWPGSGQAIACLTEMFKMHAAHGEHEKAAKLVHQVDPSLLSEHRTRKGLRVLADVGTNYPDPRVRALAADRTRVVAGQLLPDASCDAVQELVHEVRRLVPHDRLLARDCQRYQTTRRVVEKRHASRDNSAPSRQKRQLVWSFQLPDDVQWSAAASSETAVYFAGYQESLLVTVRMPLTPSAAERTIASWPVAPAFVGAPVLLCPDPHERRPLIVQAVGDGSEKPAAKFAATDELQNELAAAASPLLTQQTCAVVRSSDGMAWVVDQDADQLILRSHGPDEHLLSSNVISLPSEADVDAATVDFVPLAATCTHVYLAVHNFLFCIRRGVGVEAIQMKSRVIEIMVPPSDYPICAIVRCEQEVIAVWHDTTENRLETIDDSHSETVCGCTRDGRVVLVDGRRLDVYTRRQRQFQLTSRGVCRLVDPLAILAAREPGQIMICCRDGTIELLDLQ